MGWVWVKIRRGIGVEDVVLCYDKRWDGGCNNGRVGTVKRRGGCGLK